MRLLAPAKINLHLSVGGLRRDGFHPILSWMCRVALFDSLELRRVDKPGVSFRCDEAGVPADARNLAYRAAAALLPASTGVELTLSKLIPTGGGLGGGSSDAARVLLGMNRLLGLGRSTRQLQPIAQMLGSDVAFFLHGPSSLCAGRGEIVRPLPRPRANWAVLILPAMSVSTGLVYRRFDEMGLGPAGKDEGGDGDQEGALAAWRRGATLAARELLPTLSNDLEPAAFAVAPELGELRRRAEEIAGQPVRMSGSGSTLFTLFDSAGEAEAAAKSIGKELHIKAAAYGLAAAVDDEAEESTPPG